MSSPAVRPVARFLARSRVRFRNARPGSVLILVVALLVLMALIGTAALSTNTIDRYATQQNNANTQIDLLVEGVKNMAKATIVGDIKDSSTTPPSYRPAAGLGRTYDHWDMPLLVNPYTDPNNAAIAWPSGMEPSERQLLSEANDAWLSPRYPSLLAQGPVELGAPPTFTPTPGFGGNPPVWDAIGAPLDCPAGIPPAGQTLFETPVPPSAGQVVLGFNQRVTDRTGAAGAIRMQPSYMTVGNKLYPAWQFTDGGPLYLAADADGDGIADSGFRKLSVGELNGVTYYYATRIIDNGSAINVNTAWNRDHEFIGDAPGSFLGTTAVVAGTPTFLTYTSGMFPANIGLSELLRTHNRAAANLLQLQVANGTLTELGRIDEFRFNAAGTLSANFRPSGVVDAPAGTVTNGNVYVDMPPGSGSMVTAQRTDFVYNSLSELLYFGLARRLDNPGVIVGGATPAQDQRFQRFSLSDAGALVYHFCLTNPSASLSTLERKFIEGVGTTSLNAGTLDSVYKSAMNSSPDARLTPYRGKRSLVTSETTNAVAQQAIADWFHWNFNWDKEFGIDPTGPSYAVEIPLDPNNPTNNPAPTPVHEYCNRRTMLTTYNAATNQVPRGTNLPTGPGVPSAFTKASVNTSTFDELYGAFLSVMSEGNGETPYTAAYPGAPVPLQPKELYLYAGQRFGDVTLDATMAPVPTADRANAGTPDVNGQRPALFRPSAADTNPQRMFRTSIRDNTQTTIGSRTAQYDDASNTVTAPTDSSQAVQFRPQEMLKLRARLAAANALSMRTPSHSLPGTAIPATDTNALKVQIAGTETAVTTWIYPVEPQPYITEVYVNTDTIHPASDYDASGPGTVNAQPYVAIELFYPYEVPNTDPGAGAPDQTWEMGPRTTTTPPRPAVRPWSLAVVNRTRVAGGALTGTTIIHTFTAADDAAFPPPPAGGSDKRYGSYIILENYDTSAANGVTYRPRSSHLPYTDATTPLVATHNADTTLPPIKRIFVPRLAEVLRNGAGQPGGELVLFKPQGPVGSTIPDKPIDSFDFSGLGYDTPGRATVWHYARQGKEVGGTGAGQFWRFVYPGKYDPGLTSRRHQGTQEGSWNNDGANDPGLPENRDPFDPLSGGPMSPLPTLGMRAQLLAFDNASRLASQPVMFTAQLLNTDQPGWNPVGMNGTGLANRFPFGGFARNSDIMQVPYFGTYRIQSEAGADIEINSISMDASFCEDTDQFDDETGPAAVGLQGNATFEQVGRFCPLSTLVNAGSPLAFEVDDLSPRPEHLYRYLLPGAPGEKAWRYRWTTRLFDFLTVQNPQNDYSPNIDPSTGYAPTPVPVSNEGGTAGGYAAPAVQNAENAVPLHGLININTASWRVLSAINWTPFDVSDTANRDRCMFTISGITGEYELTAGPNGVDDNVDIAKAIVWWRDGISGAGVTAQGPHGPFRSIFDLYRVSAVRTYYNLINSTAPEPDDAQGDFSPKNPPTVTATDRLTDEVRYDFEERFQLLNRVGNLITTRSDTFTVYILVQGWRNAGSTDASKPPELVVERRAAFIADRSGITASGGQLKIINVPTE